MLQHLETVLAVCVMTKLKPSASCGRDCATDSCIMPSSDANTLLAPLLLTSVALNTA
jgi:hypothetical protein